MLVNDQSEELGHWDAMPVESGQANANDMEVRFWFCACTHIAALVLTQNFLSPNVE
jgi:hypothetical protein